MEGVRSQETGAERKKAETEGKGPFLPASSRHSVQSPLDGGSVQSPLDGGSVQSPLDGGVFYMKVLVCLVVQAGT
jgi:hypothetical protein